ncbi:VOC family protein [Flammeovirga pacifica]|uniref:VOC domain-containing protein n=1 Tax=Flammeovirga pacifica TaxID=915059 RepID=A0A1S1YT77_FLAPC|nr:VOC family protein [Flammeovirga pacifica]OHX64063.1 hypothetical protein NH26_20870 [Flammeovirga pacifica]
MSHLFIQTITTEQLKSVDFYSSLNYEIVQNDHESWAVSSASQILIGNNKQDRLGLVLFDINATSQLQKANYQVHSQEDSTVCIAPSGVKVFIKNTPPPEFSSKNDLLPGQCMGISIETPSMEASIQFWETLGFQISMGEASQGWVAMSHANGTMISLMKYGMCPHQFFNPSLTFFNGKEGNPKIIQAIKDKNIPIAEEITHFNENNEVDNIILKDPAGIGFFIFND